MGLVIGSFMDRIGKCRGIKVWENIEVSLNIRGGWVIIWKELIRIRIIFGVKVHLSMFYM